MSARGGFNPDKPDVDVLTASGLAASDGQEILAGFKVSPGSGAQTPIEVVSNITPEAGDQVPIEVNVGVFVVMNPEFQLVDGVCGDFDFAAQPDAGRVPYGANDTAWGSAGAEAAVAFLPMAVVEVGMVPVVGGA